MNEEKDSSTIWHGWLPMDVLATKGYLAKSCWLWAAEAALSTPKSSGICCLKCFLLDSSDDFLILSLFCSSGFIIHISALKRLRFLFGVDIQFWQTAGIFLMSACFLSSKSERRGYTWKRKKILNWSFTCLRKCAVSVTPRFKCTLWPNCLLYSFCVIAQSLQCWEWAQMELSLQLEWMEHNWPLFKWVENNPLI